MLVKVCCVNWQNHPSAGVFSFLFGGLFIGPASQHHAVRKGGSRQMDVVVIWNWPFKQIPKSVDVPPWLGWTRPFFSFFFPAICLIECHGNTHAGGVPAPSTTVIRRNSSSGRLGWWSWRRLEMPPHAADEVLTATFIAGA